MDLAEYQPYNPNVHSLTTGSLPDNGSNDLYPFLAGSPTNRDPALINTILVGRGLTPVNDFEKTFARKLDPQNIFLIHRLVSSPSASNYSQMMYSLLLINIPIMVKFTRSVNFRRMSLPIQHRVYKKHYF